MKSKNERKESKTGKVKNEKRTNKKSRVLDSMDTFLDFSAIATGFSRFKLEGTGQAQLYFTTASQAVGAKLLDSFLTYVSEHGAKAAFSSTEYSAIAKNITKLWYIATWDALFPVSQKGDPDGTRIVSPAAYAQGLVWKAVGVNPPAANPQGYASWATQPTILIS